MPACRSVSGSDTAREQLPGRRSNGRFRRECPVWAHTGPPARAHRAKKNSNPVCVRRGCLFDGTPARAWDSSAIRETTRGRRKNLAGRSHGIRQAGSALSGRPRTAASGRESSLCRLVMLQGCNPYLHQLEIYGLNEGRPLNNRSRKLTKLWDGKITRSLRRARRYPSAVRCSLGSPPVWNGSGTHWYTVRRICR